MSRRAQRWLFWISVAVVALQIYVVREWLAGLLLIGVIFAVVAVLGAMALVINSILVAIATVLNTAWRWLRINTAAAWQFSASAVAVARVHLAKGIFAKAVAGSDSAR